MSSIKSVSESSLDKLLTQNLIDSTSKPKKYLLIYQSYPSSPHLEPTLSALDSICSHPKTSQLFECIVTTSEYDSLMKHDESIIQVDTTRDNEMRVLPEEEGLTAYDITQWLEMGTIELVSSGLWRDFIQFDRVDL